MKTVRTKVRVSEQTYRAAKREAAKNKRDYSTWVAWLIERALAAAKEAR